MKLWQSTLEELPENSQIVWIRRWRWSDQPVLATFSFITEDFTTVGTEISIPAWGIHSWRDQ